MSLGPNSGSKHGAIGINVIKDIRWSASFGGRPHSVVGCIQRSAAFSGWLHSALGHIRSEVMDQI
jgi:hypothetical protein